MSKKLLETGDREMVEVKRLTRRDVGDSLLTLLRRVPRIVFGESGSVQRMLKRIAIAGVRTGWAKR